MKNSNADVVDDLDDIETTADDEVAPEPEEEAWNGRGVRVRLEHPLVRNHQVTGKGEPCMDCMASSGREDRTHQFHLLTSKSKSNGAWLGPDGQHMQDLVNLGYITGTPEAKARAQRQVEVDLIRGTHGSKDRPAGFPELVELSTTRLKAQWQPVLKGGVKGLMELEKNQIREATTVLLEGVNHRLDDLADSFRSALSGRTSNK